MEPKVIKSEREYRACLKEVERLVSLDPDPRSDDGARLELFALLIEAYEKRNFHFSVPDPIEAIQFRMDEQGLRQSDLVPYFGTRSRVSEVLSRKRPMTVQMIRDVSVGLGISADVLVSPTTVRTEEPRETEIEPIDWKKFPVKEMARNGYFSSLPFAGDRSLVEMARDFYVRVLSDASNELILTRRGLRGDAVNPKARYGLIAWKARALEIAGERRKTYKLPAFSTSALDTEFLKQVVRLSSYPSGMKLARELVEGIGIPVIIEPRLTGTHLDGAAMLDRDGRPVVGLTLRVDSISNFWFTLLHELAHVMKHLSQPGDAFLDRIEDYEATEALEVEANRIARDALIPRAAWRRSEVAAAPSRDRILGLARELMIHPAIVAGRVRRETKDYRAFGDLLGAKEVRAQFPEVVFEWG